MGWEDQIGVEDGNMKCYCGLPSRKQAGKSGVFFNCANPRRNCGFYDGATRFFDLLSAAVVTIMAKGTTPIGTMSYVMMGAD